MTVVANYRFDGKSFLAYCPSETDNPFVDFECLLTAALKLIADFDHIVDAESSYTGIAVLVNAYVACSQVSIVAGLVVLVVE